MTTATAVPRVKICGNTTAADVQAATRAGADAIGIITDVPVDTPREVSLNTAAELVAAVPPFATSVLVTMAETAEAVLELHATVPADAVQLHGGLPSDELATVSQRLTTIVAHDVDEDAAISRAAAHADAILLDTLDEQGGGGSGRTHDWELARSRVTELDLPVIVAGGLEPENVAEAVATTRPYGVDVATGVATSADPARKDHDAVRSFVRNARATPEVA